MNVKIQDWTPKMSTRLTGPLSVREENFDDEAAVRLRALARLERAQLGTERIPIDPQIIPDDLITHVIARTHGTAVGCGALVAIDDGIFELHRFYVRFDARGIGAGGVLLGALEQAAIQRDGSAIVVETTSLLPDTVGFFLRNGYRRIAPWGHYETRPTSVCFSKVF
ncbi:GNAT family N-acetyltransferase [Curtobacterium sp. Leaf261]|uniref:GNAT family N-acetyltransferase n=1 Tax=Curtobacterium sp. Leaf261 TaxID=1736311 RepID=UPI00138F24DB|nr:GNAT family N-acetyltransferase [Curtobacterium sp. Leaf261]